MPVRIDKYLWAIRVYKTRSIATEECRKGRILVNKASCKPSRMIDKNEIISVYKPPVNYSFKVIEPIENRVSASLVHKFAEDLTPESEMLKLNVSNSIITGYRPRGTGRPTKKERRTIDKWFEGMSNE